MRYSLCMLTMNRKDLTVDCLEHNLRVAGTKDYELLVCDNGSNDGVDDEIYSRFRPNYLRRNTTNEGVAPMFNELFRISHGDVIVLLGNDIKMPNNWLQILGEHIEAIPQTGMCSFFLLGDKGEKTVINGKTINVVHNVFGTAALPRATLNKVGYFCNRYAPYGLEDSDYHHRLKMAGLISYYVPNGSCSHLGDDVNQKTEYRQMKWDSLAKNQAIFSEQIEYYNKTGNYYIPYKQ